MGERLATQDVVTIFFSLGVLLAAARVLGECARRFNQPTVLGEILAGVVLGPTVIGAAAPELIQWLFPRQGSVALVLDGLVTVAIALFLLVAGMEVDLSAFWRQGRAAFTVSLGGLVLPFALGLTAAFIAPEVLGRQEGASRAVFALFFATALSISALPVIARVLMDLNIYRSDLGMIVIAAAVFNDLTGWMIFAVILGLLGAGSGSVATTILVTVGFAAAVLTVGRWLIHRSLPWIHAHASWPGGVLGFALALGLLSAGFTEWIGVHAVFGAFLMGTAIGDSSHLREHTRTIIHQFVSFIFAPLFFASIGLRFDFLASFDWGITLAVLLIGGTGKIVGGGLGALWGGIARREAWAIGFAMNIHGAMEIILGLLALQSGLIGQPMFVAIVVMALVTPLVCGAAMRQLLRLKNPRRLDRFLSAKAFAQDLKAVTSGEAIRDLARLAAATAGLDEQSVASAVLEREAQGATGIGENVAVPHARIDGLKQPVVAVGISEGGIDFDAPDGEPARLIFLLLTPRDDDGAQLEILADIARKFGDDAFRARAVQVNSFTEFLALLRTFPEQG